MARPKKIGLDYFPVDTSFDEKMQSFDLIYKNDGITFMVFFWQSAYRTTNGEVDLSGLFGELMANKCRITTEKMQEMLNTAKTLNLLYQTESGTWTSNGIKNRISLVSKEREDAIQRQELNKSKVKETPHYSKNNDNYLENNKNTNIIVIDQILAYLNEKTHSHFHTDTSHYISGRLKEGYTTKDIWAVIDKKCAQWLNDDNMRRYLRPKTLFAPGHFEEYLNEPEKPTTNYTWKPQ